ncbi:hypothetical protein BH93_02425 [Rhodococcoides fascians A25f]|uniref:hypothetical protein n=1 Tax=Rhodococcoides fascians TaxID=1828 RepID=UPI00055EE3BA|nr:hypothetical protein [Rhodococcus fascians]QII04371.1 hypothetical protein BH93_02425 [Rhodococcus fascians A25f]
MTLALIVVLALVVFLVADLVWLVTALVQNRRNLAATVREERLRVRRLEADAERQLFAVSEHALREMLCVAREDAARGREWNR